MSYDLAVWEGNPPADDREALSVHLALFDEYLEADIGELLPGNPLVKEFVTAMAERWPDSLGEDTPWSAGAPDEGSAAGPIAYLAISYSRAEEVAAYAESVAAELGLICFDINQGRLRTCPPASRR
ncbi:hypothetical protein SAMN04489712_106292 [Thermomonospora echinospora]|uniref:Uncharacterized protein n=1 Tax=Thermomonospora echinospora TaxID=1992 RepID=A0A1H6B5S5_9ACTN|nr:hypothetical protein [Thermomonospora echinospora]SEG56189.1 hypothetical protein SAMN04489712_106292 [Thermomonospora echinospora]